MKYSLQIYKSEHKDVEVFADSPVAAMMKAKEANPTFTVDNATELLDEDEPGETFEVFGHCGGCSGVILTGDKYYRWGDENCIIICLACGGAHPGYKLDIA